MTRDTKNEKAQGRAEPRDPAHLAAIKRLELIHLARLAAATAGAAVLIYIAGIMAAHDLSIFIHTGVLP